MDYLAEGIMLFIYMKSLKERDQMIGIQDSILCFPNVCSLLSILPIFGLWVLSLIENNFIGNSFCSTFTIILVKLNKMFWRICDFCYNCSCCNKPYICIEFHICGFCLLQHSFIPLEK